MAEPVELNGEDPLELFRKWMDEATSSEPNDPTAAALATASRDGRPSVRMVLIKGFDEAGFRFFTNAESRKGAELQTNARAALCFHWKSLRRQVRIEGSVSELPDPIVDRYFHSRSRGSQIAAAVSIQSAPLVSRDKLESDVAAFSAEHEGQEIARPVFWKGYRLKPEAIEFWADGPDRLHYRVVFHSGDAGWQREFLYP